jgi:hypothetical protein
VLAGELNQVIGWSEVVAVLSRSGMNHLELHLVLWLELAELARQGVRVVRFR